MAVHAAPTPIRRADRRTEADELRLEVAARVLEHAEFAASVREASWRIARFLEADLPVEAHQTAGGLFASAIRRLRQLDSEGAA